MLGFHRYSFLLSNIFAIPISSPAAVSLPLVAGKIELLLQGSPFLFLIRTYSTTTLRIKDSNIESSRWLLAKYSRDGRMLEARQLFDTMPKRDVFVRSNLITGYVKCGMMKEAKELFDRVDAIKDVITWTAMIRGYIKIKQFSEAESLFYVMPDKNVVSWNTMIDGYARSGNIDAALALFERMPERTVVSWNTILGALAQCGRIDEAKRVFDRMPERDVVSWTTMVTGLSRNGKIDDARLIFDRMPVKNVISWNAMITSYAQNSRLNDAIDLFERMPQKIISSWNSMITGMIQNGDMGRARMLFDEMPHKNVISWTAMITGCVQEGQHEEALKMFTDMQRDDGVRPSSGTFVVTLSACSSLSGITEGRQIHQLICKSIEHYHVNTFVVSALINMYSKCGDVGSASKIFNECPISHRDLISWNGMIVAYAHHGCVNEAIGLFEEMKRLGLKPGDVTYLSLLTACSHAGLVEQGLRYFEELASDKFMSLREDHYACLVDIYGRAGKLNEALKFIEQLGEKSSARIWGALLAGCINHGNADIGKLAATKLLKASPENAGSYMLLFNIYASTGKWKEAARIRLLMKDETLKKQPGCSWIEIANRFHVFVVGDKSHYQAKLINSVLCDLHAIMKKSDSIIGYNSCPELDPVTV